MSQEWQEEQSNEQKNNKSIIRTKILLWTVNIILLGVLSYAMWFSPVAHDIQDILKFVIVCFVSAEIMILVQAWQKKRRKTAPSPKDESSLPSYEEGQKEKTSDSQSE